MKAAGGGVRRFAVAKFFARKPRISLRFHFVATLCTTRPSGLA
jgi:hypothetical protein